MRYLVDAMNVIGARPDGWWRDRQAALAALVQRLEIFAERERAEVTVVLERPLPICSSVLTVTSAPAAADSADDEIIRLLDADEHPHDIVVITSDATLARRARGAGAQILSAGRFRDNLDRLDRPGATGAPE
ncbi:NYN domain-containing protein [Mycolicibacterium neoaurum]|uniref:NYN domain-containing protein n=1 Tax=Mycolicibacterium neoaurum TaxID=1795 RepID=UPI00248CAA91|nr:NYN domain-containing protein [Mycolicibacterium neoaurum]WBP95739.1 NYN domain-containing protein [Mycolicibacterium neoaurum]WBS09422.1 NYN domain-containing protein [Mycolicibacterium neoaurum]